MLFWEEDPKADRSYQFQPHQALEDYITNPQLPALKATSYVNFVVKNIKFGKQDNQNVLPSQK